jgi:hypothetical protein
MQHYELRAESRAALVAMLDAAQSGKVRPFLVQDETGDTQVDASRIRYPYEEMTEEEEPAPTGFWLCEVWLDEPDAELAAMAGV